VYSRLQLQYLDVMGIPAWLERKGAVPAFGELPPSDVGCDDPSAWLSILALTGDPGAVLTGPADASLLLLSDSAGESPGEPFSGRSGHLLDAMLKAIDLSRGNVLLASAAVAAGAPVPVLSALGQHTAASTVRAMLYFTEPGASHQMADIDGLREQTHTLKGGLPCVVSYHPSWLLLHGEQKGSAWNDLKRIRSLLD